MPAELQAALADPTVKKAAWNYNFEKDIFQYVLGLTIPQVEWYDPSVLCSYMSLPTKLQKAGDALAISGKKIILGDDAGVKLFSIPKKSTKKMLATGNPPLYFKDWDSNPEQWEEFCTYCKQDVIAERDVHYAAIALCSPMTEEEHAAWLLDQRMNDTGVYVDQVFVCNGKKIAEVEANDIVEELKTITGCENPNSGTQLKAWLKTRGYPQDYYGYGVDSASLDTEHVTTALTLNLPEDVHQVFVLKDRLGGSAYKKFQSIQDRIGPDGRLHDQFVYHGAHTGRWSGRGVQLQNLYKPDKAASKHTDELVQMILDNTFKPDPFGIQTMTAVASVIRAAFCAAPGNKLVVGDLAQIESRGLAALAGCKAMLDAYANGHDLYVEFMSDALNKPASEIDSDERARGKVVVLGCGFGMGVDKFIEYAAGFGITLQMHSDDPTEFTAEKAVYGFREKYHEIPAYWKALNAAVLDAMKFSKPIYARGVIVDGRNKRCLRIKLPSGRYIHYFNPKLHKKEKFGKMSWCVSYTAFTEKGPVEKDLYGGLICENITQAVARDILLNGMFEAEKAGFKVIMTIHDEIAAEVPLDSLLTKEDLYKCMSTCPSWGEGMGLVLAAEGYESRYYRK
jgi:DNA polymerase